MLYQMLLSANEASSSVTQHMPSWLELTNDDHLQLLTICGGGVHVCCVLNPSRSHLCPIPSQISPVGS